MDLLIDSHVLLWTILGDPRLKPGVRSILADRDNRVYISLASLWEIGIKLAQGRLTLPEGGLTFVLDFVQRWRIQVLPITLEHVRETAVLPFHHGDPFDRMLIAQAGVEALRLVSGDAMMRLYSGDIFW